MEEMNKRELDLWEMDKVSGGAGKSGNTGRCVKCEKKLNPVRNNIYWCENEDCEYYHKEVQIKSRYIEP